SRCGCQFFFSSRRRHTRFSRDWSSDVCSSDLSPRPHLIGFAALGALPALFGRFHPPEERGRIVALCGLWQTIAVGSMSALSLFRSEERRVVKEGRFQCSAVGFEL